MLKFSFPENKDKEALLLLCKDILRGTESYTELMTDAVFDEGAFIKGTDFGGNIKSLVFNNGDGFVPVFGEEFPPYVTLSDGNIMIYTSPDSPVGDAEITDGRRLQDFFLMISESERLSFDDERRYVIRRKRINKGLSAVFSVYDNEKIIAGAAVSAINEKYALISDVFTRKEYRKKGLAEKCLSTALSFILKKGKIPFLICSDDMCRYYEKAGFTYYGKL